MPFLNKIIMQGYIITQPVLRATAMGTPYGIFFFGQPKKSMAGFRRPDLVIQVNCYKEFAESVVRRFKKGDEVIIVGKLENYTEVNDRDETTRIVYTVLLNEITFASIQQLNNLVKPKENEDNSNEM